MNQFIDNHEFFSVIAGLFILAALYEFQRLIGHLSDYWRHKARQIQ